MLHEFYAIRIQALDGYDKIMNEVFTTERFPRRIRVHHTGKKGDNPHYHLLICTDYKNQALRAELKKYFKLSKGNKHLSIKTWDGNIKAVAYLFHEGTEPDLIKGFTDEELKTAREINRQVKETIKKNAPAQIVQDCTDYFIGDPSLRCTRRSIFEYIFKRLDENGDWLPNKFQFDRWYVRIMCNVLDGDRKKQWIESMYDDWYSY